MTSPEPTVDQRVTALESAVATLIQEAAQLRERHALLEGRMVQGLAELKARRPPVRRRLDELEEKLAEVLPPAETPEAGVGATSGETGGRVP